MGSSEAEIFTETGNAGISIRHLTKTYGEETVLKDLSLELFFGRSYCLMAPSGAGKTTLFRILMGLEEPDSGCVELERTDSVRMKPKRTDSACMTGLAGLRISAVFQEDRLLEGLTALQNLRLVTGPQIPSAELRAALLRLLPEEALAKPVAEFSGGMKRRTAILRALLAPSDLVIMDEPFTGLDREIKLTVMELIREYTRGKLLLVSTHSEEDVSLLGAELIRLDTLSSRPDVHS